MGKKGGSSWLTVVKRAFRSPAKENDKRNAGTTGHGREEEEEKVFFASHVMLPIEIYYFFVTSPVFELQWLTLLRAFLLAEEREEKMAV